MKKILTLILVSVLTLVSVLPAFAETETVSVAESICEKIDIEYAYSVTKAISELGDNPDVGNRSCGSNAEAEAAQIILKEMEAVGLQNITTDSFETDTWSFNKGRVYYTDANGEEQYVLLGGYATNLTYCDEAEIVYVGYGTEEDYEGLDVTGKIVLFDINQNDDWWINVPAMEAYNHGALCALACNVEGYATWDDDTIGSQDFCGPSYAATFAVSVNGSNALQEVIEANGGTATVKLDVDSVVSTGTSQNLWGEIPGKTEEVIYFFAHYDGYYHSYFDDAQGVGANLAIAKALVESGYTPDKTIRFVFHGAEEWGKTDTEYDWSRGAYNMITHIHPEWAETAFAILNMDGMYTVEGHTSFDLACVDELTCFAAPIAQEVFEGSAYEINPIAFTSCWTEDFSYIRAGVPAIIANHAEPYEIYQTSAYHSSSDNIKLGVDMEAWKLVTELFTKLCLSMDSLAVRPMEFTSHFEAMEALYAGETELDFAGVYEAAKAVDEKIVSMNASHAEAVVAGDTETAEAIRAQGIELDKQLYAAYDFVTDNFLSFDYDDNTIFPFEMNEWAIEALEAAIPALEEGDVATVYDELLYNIDFNWYAYAFSQDTYEYLLDKMNNKTIDTWGEGMIRYPGENLWAVIHSLADKYEAEDADLTEEISALQTALENQYSIRSEIEARMVTDLSTAAANFAAIVAE